MFFLVVVFNGILRLKKSRYIVIERRLSYNWDNLRTELFVLQNRSTCFLELLYQLFDRNRRVLALFVIDFLPIIHELALVANRALHTLCDPLFFHIIFHLFVSSVLRVRKIRFIQRSFAIIVIASVSSDRWCILVNAIPAVIDVTLFGIRFESDSTWFLNYRRSRFVKREVIVSANGYFSQINLFHFGLVVALFTVTSILISAWNVCRKLWWLKRTKFCFVFRFLRHFRLIRFDALTLPRINRLTRNYNRLEKFRKIERKRALTRV